MFFTGYMNKYVRILLIVVLTVVGQGSVIAQHSVCIVDSIEAAGSISIDQPEALTRLLTHRIVVSDHSGTEQRVDHQSPHAQRTGYRVQIFDDNNPRTARAGAEAVAAQVSAAYPYLHTYRTFASPYWRVKAGDFRTRAEAEAMLEELRVAFPALKPYLRVVRDKINIHD